MSSPRAILARVSIFDFLWRKKPTDRGAATIGDESFDRYLANLREKDYLGKAAAAGAKAREAFTAGDYDAAWALYQDVKALYLKHASRERFTAAQTIRLDAAVSQPLANILRLEGRHHDALTHIVYWVAASAEQTGAQKKKLAAYFNRCKFRSVEISDLHSLVESLKPLPDFVKIRNAIADWRDQDPPAAEGRSGSRKRQ